MSLLDKASLILTPNAYKASKLYSIIPSNGNGDMTFLRNTSATRDNSSGLVELVGNNIPRLEYDGSCPSIILEPQRTNLVRYSEQFSDSSWEKANTAISPNVINAPNGNLTADLVARTSTTLGCNVYQDFASGTSDTYTATIYAKLGTISTNFGLRVQGGYPNRGDALFNLSTGTLIGVANGGTNTLTSGSITNVGNGWYKLTVTTKFATTLTNVRHLYGPSSLTLINAWEGADNTLSNAYVWGAQLEAGAYPTSYIPTATIVLTRNLDDIFRTGISSLLNPSEGTFYVEIAALTNDLTSRSITLSDNSDYNQVTIQFSSISNQIRMDTYGKRSTTTTTNFRRIVTVSDITTFHKVAIVWGSNGIFGFVDGVKYTLSYVAGDSAGNGIPTDLTRLDFKQYYGGNYFYGKNKALGVWKTALTDTEAIALTTL